MVQDEKKTSQNPIFLGQLYQNPHVSSKNNEKKTFFPGNIHIFPCETIIFPYKTLFSI